jgi:SAM-dependent methyltransferase
MFNAKSTWLRDDYLCDNCGCIPRERALMKVIQECCPNYKDLIIHESSPCVRGVSKKLMSTCKNYMSSHYFPEIKETVYQGHYNIDLQNQYFESEMFDIVVTQDVFEHLPDPEAAIREIERTLKPGGFLFSTIPLVNKWQKTQKWANLVDGKVSFIYEADYHANPINPEGSAVFWHFGYDIAQIFTTCSNLKTMVIMVNDKHLGIEGELLEVIVSRKI